MPGRQSNQSGSLLAQPRSRPHPETLHVMTHGQDQVIGIGRWRVHTYLR